MGAGIPAGDHPSRLKNVESRSGILRPDQVNERPAVPSARVFFFKIPGTIPNEVTWILFFPYIFPDRGPKVPARDGRCRLVTVPEFAGYSIPEILMRFRKMGKMRRRIRRSRQFPRPLTSSRTYRMLITRGVIGHLWSIHHEQKRFHRDTAWAGEASGDQPGARNEICRFISFKIEYLSRKKGPENSIEQKNNSIFM
jgi:hypothetical protein